MQTQRGVKQQPHSCVQNQSHALKECTTTNHPKEDLEQGQSKYVFQKKIQKTNDIQTILQNLTNTSVDVQLNTMQKRLPPLSNQHGEKSTQLLK